MEESKVNGIEKTIEQQNSVKISINAKGLFAGECKVYAGTIEEAYKQATDYASKLQTLITEKNGL